MSLTVFSEGAGLFHKGSSGKGVAPGDVCLSPPPPPAGPAPVPYVNSLSAGDLADGSETVLVDGNPTALEDHSYVSTSTGDEGGTQGGSVVTHKTKGKGFFKVWSFTVQIEGKGICRHGDSMGQNCASDPPSCIDMEAVTAFRDLDWVIDEPCEEKYNREDVQEEPNDDQYDEVANKNCWQCGADDSYKRDADAMVPDHQPPMAIAWYLGGCHDPDSFEEWANQRETVKPHCLRCSDAQKNVVSAMSQGGQPSFAATAERIMDILGL